MTFSACWEHWYSFLSGVFPAFRSVLLTLAVKGRHSGFGLSPAHGFMLICWGIISFVGSLAASWWTVGSSNGTGESTFKCVANLKKKVIIYQWVKTLDARFWLFRCSEPKETKDKLGHQLFAMIKQDFSNEIEKYETQVRVYLTEVEKEYYYGL